MNDDAGQRRRPPHQAARRAMREQGAPFAIWFYMAPALRNPDS